MALQGREPDDSARKALLLAMLTSGVLAFVHETPGRWAEPDLLSPTPITPEPLASLWAALLHALPGGRWTLRTDGLALALVVLLGALSGALTYRIYRRLATSVVASGLVCIALLPTLQPSPDVIVIHGIALMPTLAAMSWVPRDPTSSSRRAQALAIAITSLTFAFDPRTGLMGWVLAMGFTLATPSPDDGGRLGRLLVASSPGFVALIGWTMLHASPLSWPDIAIADTITHEPITDLLALAGGTFLALLGVATRDRGAAMLLMLLVTGLGVSVDGHPLLPRTAAVILLAVAASGWIRMLGGLGRRAWQGVLIEVTVAAVLVGPALSSARLRPRAIADERPLHTMRRVYDRGLIAPGDAVFVFGPWMTHAQRDREIEGWRPDIRFVDASRLDSGAFLDLTMEWDAMGRRVMSDSFDGGGHWDPAWMVDSGPLFWFVGRGSITDPEFTDLTRLEPDLAHVPPHIRTAWVNLAIERARFRRHLGEIEAALHALPLSAQRRRGLLTRLQVARSLRPTPAAASELRPPYPQDDPPLARVTAECGDLLYSFGEHRRATELFVEAADRGSTQALSALARWQFRAGQERQAQTTLGWIATNPTSRADAIALGHWLLDRDRNADTTTLLRLMRQTPAALAAAEIGLRLRSLRHPSDEG